MRASNISVLKFSEEIALLMAEKILLYSIESNNLFHIALSINPVVLRAFEILSSPSFVRKVQWEQLHFWWVDEHHSAPTGFDNYSYCNDRLFSKVAIPKANIHRIYSDADPRSEIVRYMHDMVEFLPIVNGYPRFDLILLGMGEDGHIASLYPEIITLPNASTHYTCVVQNPKTGEFKISLLLDVINSAERVFFLISGVERADPLYHIFKMDPISMGYPAAYVDPTNGILMWLVDREAASKIQAEELG